ncbi:NSS family neurotransmitter:Na+ symporter [Alkalihalobacillus xiaoxiensis]|uniref:Transporter n=1 Tax=Shouchella xiaoxiensis TaxID=766895 RepID=A0ABS2SX76_9BACI|nr:sodium-dependent transporter [Shouchella xiaoxiensis]MBM7840089.1 NSS family neurotransmitter:Na+ symporter [Shouchella xiaoxiensis]
MESQQWSSKYGFILAAAGSAIGLGAIWKFPYIAGVNGGGAFFLVFIIFTLFVGLPLLIGEFLIGRSTQKNAVDSYKEIAPGSSWHLLGRMGMVTAFLLLSFYSVVGGWILIYIWKTITGDLTGLDGAGYEAVLNQTISNPYLAVGFHFLFLVLVIVVVAKGVQSGIEKASVIMMPALFILFLVVVIRSLTLDGAMEGVQFLLVPDFQLLTSEGVLFALGQSFFALSLGISVMVTYSSYLSKKENLLQSASAIVIMNFIVALLAGLAIFPAVFSFGLNPAQGPPLIFAVLPTVFSQVPFGMVFLLLFLILFLFAALTSAFSMLEIIVSSQTRGDVTKRKKSSWIIGLLIFIVGIPSALSYGVWSEFELFGLIFFDAVDYLVSNILLPVGALLIALFISLRMPRERLVAEFTAGNNSGKKLFVAWLLFIKYVVPLAIVVVFLDVIGVFDWIFGS